MKNPNKFKCSSVLETGEEMILTHLGRGRVILHIEDTADGAKLSVLLKKKQVTRLIAQLLTGAEDE